MLARVATASLEDSEIGRNIEANRISNAIREHLLSITHDENQVSEIMKSPALYSVTNLFPLTEYMKNTHDAGGKKFDIYLKINDDKSLTCMVKDDGRGFPPSFLNQESGEKMVNYYAKKLKTETGEEKSKIESTKQTATAQPDNESTAEMPKQKGGRGLGLATVARILDRTGGSLLFGNLSDLPQDLQEAVSSNEAKASVNPGQAVLLMSSPPYSKEMNNLFTDPKSMTATYLHHVDGIEKEKLEQEAERLAEALAATQVNTAKDQKSEPNDQKTAPVAAKPKMGLALDLSESAFEMDQAAAKPKMGLKLDLSDNAFETDQAAAKPKIGLTLDLSDNADEDQKVDQAPAKPKMGLTLDLSNTEDSVASTASNVSDISTSAIKSGPSSGFSGAEVDDDSIPVLPPASDFALPRRPLALNLSDDKDVVTANDGNIMMLNEPEMVTFADAKNTQPELTNTGGSVNQLVVAGSESNNTAAPKNDLDADPDASQQQPAAGTQLR